MSDDDAKEIPREAPKGALGWYKPPKNDILKDNTSSFEEKLDYTAREIKRIGQAFFDLLSPEKQIKDEEQMEKHMISGESFNGEQYDLWVFADANHDIPISELNVESFEEVTIRIETDYRHSVNLQTQFGVLPDFFKGKDAKIYCVRNEYEINRRTGVGKKLVGVSSLPHRYASLDQLDGIASVPDFEMEKNMEQRHLDLTPEDMEQLQGWLELIRIGGFKKFIPKTAA